MACLALQYYSTLSHTRYDFRKKKKNIGHNMCFISLQVLAETFLILGRTERDMIKNLYWSSCKVRVILVRLY